MTFKETKSGATNPGFSIGKFSTFRWDKANTLLESATIQQSTPEKITALERSAKLLERNVKQLGSDLEELAKKAGCKDETSLKLLDLVRELKQHFTKLQGIYDKLVTCYEGQGDTYRATKTMEKLTSTLYRSIDATPPFLLDDALGKALLDMYKSAIPRIYKKAFEGYAKLIARPLKPDEPKAIYLSNKAMLMRDSGIAHFHLAQMNDGWLGSRDKAIEHASLALDKFSEAMDLINKETKNGALPELAQAQWAVGLLALFKDVWDWRGFRQDVQSVGAIARKMEKEGVNPKGNADSWSQFLGKSPEADAAIMFAQLRGVTPSQVVSALKEALSKTG
ncbi:MAG: hypothetical protein ABIF01_04830 [Candidatus Micrarchaeota archaeon]